jgi:hypothetical protein
VRGLGAEHEHDVGSARRDVQAAPRDEGLLQHAELGDDRVHLRRAEPRGDRTARVRVGPGATGDVHAVDVTE